MDPHLKVVAMLADALCVALCERDITEDIDFRLLYPIATQIRDAMPSEIKFQGIVLLDFVKREFRSP